MKLSPLFLVSLTATIVGFGGVLAWVFLRFPRARRPPYRWVLSAVAAVLVALPLLSRAIGQRSGPMWTMTVVSTGMLFAAVAELALPLIVAWEVVVRLVRWAQRRGVAEGERAAGSEPVTGDPPQPERRDALATFGGAAALVGVGATLGWGFLRTRIDPEVVTLPVRIARLPRALDGFTMVQVSDVHVGAFFGERELRRAEDLVRPLRADLVLMTGDLVHLHLGFLPMAVEWVARLGATARLGAVAIPGNHEHYAGVDRVLSALRAARVDVLLNRSRVIGAADGGGFVLAGVDDLVARKGPDLDAAFAHTPPDAPRVLLCHQPFFHPQAAAYGVDLMLSGHLHGGQIAPLGPLITRTVWGVTSGFYERERLGLYVNRGLGTSGPPSRVAVRPEITKIVLVAS